MKIFISYSRQDEEKALQVYHQLKENGFEVLADFDLKIGDSLNSLNDMLLQADAVVCLITEVSLQAESYLRHMLIKWQKERRG